MSARPFAAVVAAAVLLVPVPPADSGSSPVPAGRVAAATAPRAGPTPDVASGTAPDGAAGASGQATGSTPGVAGGSTPGVAGGSTPGVAGGSTPPDVAAGSTPPRVAGGSLPPRVVGGSLPPGVVGGSPPPGVVGGSLPRGQAGGSTSPGVVDSSPGAVGAVAAGPRGGWGWPLSPRPPVLRTFEVGPDPWSPGHRGVDLGAAAAATVRAPAAGTVTFAGVVVDRPVLVITHASGLRTSYEPVVASVPPGTVVTRGDPVGTLATGGHCARCLHWGARSGGRYVDPLLLVGPRRVVLLPLGRTG